MGRGRARCPIKTFENLQVFSTVSLGGEAMSMIAVKELTTAREVIENARRINAARRASYEKTKPTVLAVVPKVEPAPKPAPDAFQLTPEEIGTVLLMRANAESSFPIIIENSCSRIMKAVCKFYGVSAVEFLSVRRANRIARPRMVGYYLCRTLTTKSLPEIGRRFGGRDHTTIISGARRIAKLRMNDRELNDELTWLEQHLAP